MLISDEFSLNKIKISPYVIYSIFSGVIILASLLLSLFIVPDGSFIIIENKIGNASSLVSLTLVALVICGINLAFARAMHKKDRVVSHILGALAIFISALILLKITAVILSF